MLPLLGICTTAVDGIPDYPLLVSLYCREGNINDYIRRRPRTHKGSVVSLREDVVPELSLTCPPKIGQITDGLLYLHESGFVHGDLKGVS